MTLHKKYKYFLGPQGTYFSCTDGKSLVGAELLFAPIRFLLSQNGQLKVHGLAKVFMWFYVVL